MRKGAGAGANFLVKKNKVIRQVGRIQVVRHAVVKRQKSGSIHECVFHRLAGGHFLCISAGGHRSFPFLFRFPRCTFDSTAHEAGRRRGDRVHESF